MKRGWAVAAVWDLFLVGVPLVIAAILALNNWPLANDRILLAAIFLVELFFILVPASSYGPGLGPTSGGAGGPMRQPTYDEFIAAADEKRDSVGTPVGLDPIAIGPAIALLVIVVSFAISH
jgi:hypothetical protein